MFHPLILSYNIKKFNLAYLLNSRFFNNLFVQQQCREGYLSCSGVELNDLSVEMSSWLDTNFLGSLAKTAIAEAQKKLDKALDIR